MKFRSAAYLLSLSCLLSAPSALAVPLYNGYLGVLGGASYFDPENLSRGSDVIFGLTAGTRTDSNVGIGFYGTYFNDSTSSSILGIPAGTRTTTYYLTGQLDLFASVFHFGANAGVGIDTWNASVGGANIGNTRSMFIYGPEAGFDFPIGNSPVSLGAEVHYLINHESDARNNLQAMAALKIWM